jgi:hypothetical protein
MRIKPQRDMSHHEKQPEVVDERPYVPPMKSVPVEWLAKPGFAAFGDRLDFLSPEVQHLNTGTLKIMPPRNPEKRK